MKGLNWENIRAAVLAGKENLEDYSGIFAMNLLSEEQEFNSQKPFKVRDIGTGMMFISRKVFEDLKPHCKQYKNNNVGNTGVEFGEMVTEYFTTMIDENQILLSEDYAFCRMWQSIGGEVWSAPWVRITHSGDYNFAGQFARTVEIDQIKHQLRQAMASNSTQEEK